MKRRDFLAFAALVPLLPACAKENNSVAKAATPTKADTLAKSAKPGGKAGSFA